MSVEEQHFSSGPILLSIYINLFKIQALISQPFHHKESTVNTYLTQESLAAVILIMISLGFGKPTPCNEITL